TANRLASLEDAMLVPVGRKVNDYFRRRQVNLGATFINIGEEADFNKADEIASYLMDLFIKGEAGEVRLIYTRFHSAVSQTVEELQLLPLPEPEESEGTQDNTEYI